MGEIKRKIPMQNSPIFDMVQSSTSGTYYGPLVTGSNQMKYTAKAEVVSFIGVYENVEIKATPYPNWPLISKSYSTAKKVGNTVHISINVFVTTSFMSPTGAAGNSTVVIRLPVPTDGVYYTTANYLSYTRASIGSRTLNPNPPSITVPAVFSANHCFLLSDDGGVLIDRPNNRSGLRMTETSGSRYKIKPCQIICSGWYLTTESG